jgi:SAM-dependent methyltransferase
MYQMTRDIVHEFVPRYLKGEVLDVGAGTKKYQKIIEQHCDKYMTLDIEGDVDFVADAKNMPIDENSFDSILSFQMFEHVDEPQKIASEMYRVLKPGGIIISTVPFMAPEHADPNDFQRFTVHGFEYLFKKENFKILYVGKYTGPFTVFIDSIKFSYFSPYTSSKLRLKWGERILRRLYVLAKYLDKNKENTDIYGNVCIVAQK